MAGPRLAFLGNCQVQSFSVIAPLLVDDAEVRAFDYADPATHNDASRAAFADGLADADLIFAQTTGMSHTGHRELRARYPGRVVTIANFYFRGLFPDSIYVGAFGERISYPSTMNSLVVLDAFRRGLTESQAECCFNRDNLQRLGVFSAWAASIAEMRRREDPAEVDVPAAALIDEACHRYPAFLTMNHPTVTLLADYLGRAFVHAGLRPRTLNAAMVPDPLRQHDETPVLDAVAEHYGLPYRTTQRWRVYSQTARWIDRSEYVGHCYHAYRGTDVDRLRVHSPTDLVAQLETDPELRFHVAGGPVPPLTPATVRTIVQPDSTVRFKVTDEPDPLPATNVDLARLDQHLDKLQGRLGSRLQFFVLAALIVVGFAAILAR